jgi:hypothetical protein
MHQIAVSVLVGMRMAVRVSMSMFVRMGMQPIMPMIVLCHGRILDCGRSA